MKKKRGAMKLRKKGLGGNRMYTKGDGLDAGTLRGKDPPGLVGERGKFGITRKVCVKNANGTIRVRLGGTAKNYGLFLGKNFY